MKITSLLTFILGWTLCIHCVGALGPVKLVNRTDGLCESLILPQNNYDCQEYVLNAGADMGWFSPGSSKNVKYTSCRSEEGAVFLLHGVLVGGDVLWVLNSPSESLGFILADAGYDVWIGNTRNTRFSYGHTFYQRTDKGFWDWSVDELAEQDLPAMLGLVYSTTGAQVNYAGLSQGSQQAFAVFSQGQLVDYVNKVIMLAPVAYIDHATSPLALALFDLYIDKILEAANLNAIGTETPMGKQLVDIICGSTDARCYKNWFYLVGGNICCLNATNRPVIDEYETQTTSVKNFAHFAQQGRKSTFAKFDYGFWGNLKKYHSPRPPAYKIANIPTHNLFLINALNDEVANTTDVERLVGELKGSVKVYTNPFFGHFDFVLADNANSQVYNQVLAFLES